MRGLGLRSIAPVGVTTLVLLACTTPAPSPTPSATPPSGGTLRIGVADFPLAELAYADPAYATPGYLLKCCLARTLLTYPGRPTIQGGTILQLDLAAEPPTVSRDGLTWTFRLRPGIRYAPPYEASEVVAADFIRAAERVVRLSPEVVSIPGAPFEVVAGAKAYADGTAPTISGLASPDASTLVVRLDRPFGGFGTYVADVAWAPIPEGAADGHDEDFGVRWVSTGPYMYEIYPADADATTAVLVRNPSWDRATDPRRGAWVDRIELSAAGDTDAAFAMVEAGDLDLLDVAAPAAIVERYRRDPALAARLAVTGGERIFFVSMNLAVPPFDDLAVRRAVNAVVDRAALRDLILALRAAEHGPQPNGSVATHTIVDSVTGGLLVTYDPFPSRDGHGDLTRATAEMARSRYDDDGDGRCDAAACFGLQLSAQDQGLGEALARDLAKIGIEAVVVEADEAHDIAQVTNRTAIQAHTFSWGYSLTGSDLADLFRAGPDFVDADGFTLNASLVGATDEQLRGWGYTVTDVPSVDDVIDQCEIATGHLRARCWAAFDQLLSEVVVPWVPLFTFEFAHIASPRVAAFSLDQGLPNAYPGLDQIVLTDDAGT